MVLKYIFSNRIYLIIVSALSRSINTHKSYYAKTNTYYHKNKITDLYIIDMIIDNSSQSCIQILLVLFYKRY